MFLKAKDLSLFLLVSTKEGQILSSVMYVQLPQWSKWEFHGCIGGQNLVLRIYYRHENTDR